MVYLCESVCFSFINVHTTCQCTCIYWELGQYILSQWNHAQPCGQWRHSITWYINYQVRFFNLTLSAGVVCVCRVSVTTGPFFLEASAVVFMWSNGHYGVYLRPCRRIFQNFHFYPFFWVKNSQKWPKNDIFALSAGAFFSGSIYSRVHVVKWSLWGISWTMPKDFSKFSFLPLFLGEKQSKNGPKMTFLH